MSPLLREVVARYALGLPVWDAVSEAACEALAAGADSPSLRLLAGEGADSDPRDLRDLFERAMSELGIAPTDRIEAARFLVALVARRVAEGHLAPQAGARQIALDIFGVVDAELETKVYAGDGLGIAKLYGLHYDYDDVGEVPGVTRADIDEAVVVECKRLAATSTS